MSRIYFYVPCDGCGCRSYSGFYTLENGLSRQIEVREYDEMALCQPCLDEYLNETDDGLRQLDMFEDG